MSMMNIQVKYKTDRTSQWAEFGYVDIPVSGHDKLNTELDLSELIIKDTTLSTRLEKYTLIGLFIDTILKRTYYVEQDDVAQSRLTATEPLFTHDMQLVEESRIAQNFVIETRTFTNFNDLVIVKDWQHFIKELKANTSNRTIQLGNDIYYDDAYPITSSNQCILFNGILDGNGYTLHFENSTISQYATLGSIYESLGGLILETAQSSKIINLNIDGLYLSYTQTYTTETYPSNTYVGILSGKQNGLIKNIKITNCRIDCNITSTGARNINAGIVAGYCTSLSTSSDEYIYLQDNIISIAHTPYLNVFSIVSYMGSLYGFCDNAKTINNITANNVFYSIKRNGTFEVVSYIGGLIGKQVGNISITNASLKNSYRIIDVTTDHIIESDAIVANVITGEILSNVYYDNNFVVTDNVSIDNTALTGATGIIDANMYKQTTYTGFNFDLIWNISEDITLPYIKLFKVIDINASYSLLDVLERICSVIPLKTSTLTRYDDGLIGVVDSESIFSISDDLKSDIIKYGENNISPEYVFDKMTLWEMLLFIGGKINAIPYIQDYEIHYMFLNRENSVWTPTTNATYSRNRFTQNGAQYATELVSFNSNIISENGETDGTIIYPDVLGWITPRSNDISNVRINNSTAEILLPIKIYEIKKVLVKNIFTVAYGGIVNGGGANDTIYDITDYVVNKKIYDALPDTKVGKGSKLVYDQYGNTIYNFANQPLSGYIPLEPALTEILTSVSGASVAAINPYKNIMFRIYYKPSYDNATSTGRDDSSDFNTYSELNYNQDSNQVTSENLGRNKVAKLNQMGVIETEQDFTLPTFNDLPTIGQTYNGLFINEVIWNLYNNLVKCTIVLTKDFNRISEYIDINRRKRPYVIPADEFIENCHLRYKEYIMFDTLTSENTSFINNEVLQNALIPASTQTFVGDFQQKITACLLNGYNKITSNQVKSIFAEVQDVSDPDTITGILLTTTNNYSGNGLTFTVKFDTNVIAGYWTDEYDTNNNIARPVLYTENGRLDYIEPRFITKYKDTQSLNDSFILPLTTYDLPTGYSCIDFTGKPLRILKDAREIIYLNYEIQFKKKNQNIILGNKIISQNSLIYYKDGVKTRKVYGLKQKLGTYDNVINNTIADEITNSTITVNTTDNSLQVSFGTISDNYVGWVITDELGFIYIGYNENLTPVSTNSSKIYVYGKGAN